MSKKIRAYLQIALCIIVFLAILIGSFALWFTLRSYGEVYETTRLDQYGRITGNFVNDVPEAFIHSFFPESIEDSFSQIIYHYKAKKGDGYAYECYLEFVIEDTDDYEDFIERYIERESSVPFVYDESFQEQSVSNVLSLQTPEEKTVAYPIGTAELGKILYSDEQHRIIFVAIGMYDGGGANTIELGHFFTRFQIDPFEYMKSAYPNAYHQELGIQNKDTEHYQYMISQEQSAP